MHFLVDAQLPPALCEWLTAKGHRSDHVAARGMIAASDAHIAQLALAERLTIVSKDEDFRILQQQMVEVR